MSDLEPDKTLVEMARTPVGNGRAAVEAMLPDGSTMFVLVDLHRSRNEPFIWDPQSALHDALERPPPSRSDQRPAISTEPEDHQSDDIRSREGPND